MTAAAPVSASVAQCGAGSGGGRVCVCAPPGMGLLGLCYGLCEGIRVFSINNGRENKKCFVKNLTCQEN